MNIEQKISNLVLEATEHPHIVKISGLGGGEPLIRGTRISVHLIAEYYKSGMTVEDVLRDYPHLNAAAIYDAISYYIDHQEEIEALITANRIESVIDIDQAMDVDGRIRLEKEPQG